MSLQDRFDLSANHAKLSQTEIARILGVAKGTISQFRQGKHTIANGFQRIAKVLNVPTEWLKEGTGPAPHWYAVPASVLPSPPSAADVNQKMLEMLANMQANMAIMAEQLAKLTAEHQAAAVKEALEPKPTPGRKYGKHTGKPLTDTSALRAAIEKEKQSKSEQTPVETPNLGVSSATT